MSKDQRTGAERAQLSGIDQLFGRDLRQGGWSVDETLVRTGRGRPALEQAERPAEPSPDPAVIWALRNRRR